MLSTPFVDDDDDVGSMTDATSCKRTSGPPHEKWSVPGVGVKSSMHNFVSVLSTAHGTLKFAILS